MIDQYNRQPHRIYPLDERGFHQAERNNSHQIWSLLSWEEEVIVKKQHEQTFQTTINEQTQTPLPALQEDKPKPIQAEDKQDSFKLSKNYDKKETTNKRENVFTRSGPQPIKKQPVEQTEYERPKRKSIEKYIKEQVPYTRTLSNSAFRKFYQRPCQEAYGRKNTSTQRGAFYGNFMKTHNVQPHTLDNKPETYQTYTSALNFGKRTKLDLEDRWKRIERQLAKNLDTRELAYMKAVGQIDITEDNKDKILKQNIGIYGAKEGRKYPETQKAGTTLTKSAKSLGKLETQATFKNITLGEQLKALAEQKKRSKSSDKPLYYIYKMEQDHNGYNCTRYARDRHGLTCYVDNAFGENDQAYTQFMKKIKPILPEQCKPEDMNIDQIRINNCQKAKEEELPRHYLIPNVETPYVAAKYTRKRKSSTVEPSS